MQTARRKRAAWLATLVVLGLASAARASDTDEFGFGPRGIAMGGAFTALATDSTATYYNPAGLAMTKGLSILAGYSYAGYELDFDADALGSADESRTERQVPLSAFSLGFATTLGDQGFLSRIGVGFGIFSPSRQLVGYEVEAAPGRPTYMFYGARRDKVAILPGVALRILPFDEHGEGQRLSIGGGLTALVDIDGEIVFDLDINAPTAARADLKLAYDVAPNFGIFYWPTPWLSIGAAYRGELSMKTDLNIVVDLDGDGISDFPLGFEAVGLFQPHQLQVGLAVDPLDVLTLSFDVTWLNWSAFQDPFLTIEPILAQVDPDLDDIFVPRVGAEWRVHDSVSLRFGYFYRPSPLPEQDGPTNLVDPDKHVFSFGAGYTHWTIKELFWREGEEIRSREIEWDPFSIDAFVQLHWLPEESVRKADPANSGGVGAGYDAGGLIWNLGIFITVRV